jgi:hypothetical protein
MENLKCEHQHYDCNQPAIKCTIEDDLQPEYFCIQHARENGYCFVCGYFSEGSEGFDIIHPGICNNCFELMISEY